MLTEVTKDLQLSEHEEDVLIMHSFFNVLNTISAQLQLLQIELDAEHCFQHSLSLVNTIKSACQNVCTAAEQSSALLNFREIVLKEIRTCVQGQTLSAEQEHHVRDVEEDLESIFAVVQVRVRELLQRVEGQGDWVKFQAFEIEENLKQVLLAIAKNSHGRYGIVFDRQEQTATDYLVIIRIDSNGQDTISMPALVQDCIRDLTANARKYTDPGGTIEVLIQQRTEDIFVQVRDTGWGIPEDELDKVVDFGFRASNVQGKETRGGGFGLTKAYYVTAQYGGSMWIDSRLGQGTAISLRIPL